MKNTKTYDYSSQLELIKKRGGNKQCFDCGEKGTTYAVMSFGTFVCSRCAGLLRELNYKVKGTGVCIFTEKEVKELDAMGNDNARLIWLGKFRENRDKLPNPKSSDEIKKHLIEKYNEKRYYKKEKKSKDKNKKKEKEESDSEDDEEEEENDDDDDDEEKDSDKESSEEEKKKKKKPKGDKKKKDKDKNKDKKHKEKDQDKVSQDNNKKPVPLVNIKHPNKKDNFNKKSKGDDIEDQFEFYDDSNNKNNENNNQSKNSVSGGNNIKQDDIWNIWDNQSKQAIKPQQQQQSTTNTTPVFDFTNIGQPMHQENNPPTSMPVNNQTVQVNPPQPKTMSIDDLSNALNNLSTNPSKGNMGMGNGMGNMGMGMGNMGMGMGNMGMNPMNQMNQMMNMANMTPQQQQQMMMYMYQMMNNNQMNYNNNNLNNGFPNQNSFNNPNNFHPSTTNNNNPFNC